MKRILNLLFFVLFINNISAQEYAEFTADTDKFSNYYKKHGKLPDYVSSQVWYINGKEMRYDSGAVRIKPNPKKLDTILYKRRPNSKFDTIICNVSIPLKYKFYYNDCCGAFFLWARGNDKPVSISNKVKYKLKKNTDKTYIGTFGESAIFLKKRAKSVTRDCKSVMSPNVYNLSIREIEICEDDPTCNYKDEDFICLKKTTKVKKNNTYYDFNTISKKKIFSFIPLSPKPLKIIYDPETDTISLK